VKGESVMKGDSIYDQVLSGVSHEIYSYGEMSFHGSKSTLTQSDRDYREKVLVYDLMLSGVSAEIHFHRRMSFHGPNSTLTQSDRDFREKVLVYDMMLSGVSDRM